MNFLDVITTEIRKQSKQHYLFEEIEGNYKNDMIKIFNKAIQDELSACSVYYLIASQLTGFEEVEIAEEFQKHAKEEYEHFTELLDYASNHGIEGYLNLNLMPYTQQYPVELQAVIDWKQNLEKESMNDYLAAAKLAEEKGDVLTMDFFKELAKDKSNHINDLLKFTDIGYKYL